MSSPNHKILDFQRAIRRYCADHPNAADTLDGVQGWWLGDLAGSREDVERALRELVELGDIDERQLVDGGILYSCPCRAE